LMVWEVHAPWMLAIDPQQGDTPLFRGMNYSDIRHLKR
jgi:hypothetical protein